MPQLRLSVAEVPRLKRGISRLQGWPNGFEHHRDALRWVGAGRYALMGLRIGVNERQGFGAETRKDLDQRTVRYGGVLINAGRGRRRPILALATCRIALTLTRDRERLHRCLRTHYGKCRKS